MASSRSQARAHLGPGGYCRRSGNGGPQTCLPAACGVAQRGAQHVPSSSTQIQDPREGPSLAGQTTRNFLRHGLIRLAREEAERSRRGTSRGARDASHDDQGRQAGASLRSVLLVLVLLHRNGNLCLMPRYSAAALAPFAPKREGGLRDGGHRGAQDGVVTRALHRRRLVLSG